MSEDGDMARLYQEAYGDVKADKEHDYNESVRIHDKYSYLYDRDSLDDKVPTNKYNVQDEKPTIEEEIMTTELSDEELDLVYKRYKLMQAENNDFMRDADEEANELIQKYNANAAKSQFSDRAIRTPDEYMNELGLIMNKKNQRQRFNIKLENFMAQIRFLNAVEKMKPADVYNINDPNYPGQFPINETRGLENVIGDLPAEFRKLFNQVNNIPEMQSGIRGFVFNETQAREHEYKDELREKYFRAKWDYYVKESLSKLKILHKDLEEAASVADGLNGHDAQKQKRAEYMYSFADYDNDRAKVRERFITEYNKKTTLKDIGEMLDKFVLDEKAEGLRYMDFTKDEQVKSAAKDTSNFEMSWTGRIFKDTDPLKPLLMDDESPLDGMGEGTDTAYRDILDRIKYEDERTDYSKNSLNQDQRTEIALFHSFKQDPFFKHYLYNHLRQFSEDIDEGVINFPEGPFTRDV